MNVPDTMLNINNAVTEISNCTAETISDDILNATKPLVLKNFAANWPVVQHGKRSNQDAAKYLLGFYSNTPVAACYAEPEAKGRIYYNTDFSGVNYRGANISLATVLEKLLNHCSDDNPPTMYVGSTEINQCLPGFNQANNAGIDALNPLTSIWLGNASRVAAHYDFPNNLAICAVGKRRFTLFPPEQLKNLYVGPMEFAPGGQDISLVDFAEPDFVKFPKFKQALENAQVAELSAGDALFLPSMWWHHVEALTPFNVLISHWWRNSPAHMGRPNNALQLAMLSLRNLPREQRLAWKAHFDHYIFDHDGEDLSHIPTSALGRLTKPLDEETARKLRADLLNKLKR